MGKNAIEAARKFEGPFLILGMLPSWPQELERRKDYAGPHTQISSLFPIQAVQPHNGFVAPAQTFKERVAKLGLSSEVVDKAGPWKRRVERQARQVSDDKLTLLLSALDKPRTAKQIGRKIHVSRPTVDYWMRALQISIGAALKIRVMRQGSRGPLAKFFWVEKSHARA